MFTLKLWGVGLPWCLGPICGWGIARPFSIKAGCIEPLEALKWTGVLSCGIWSKKGWQIIFQKLILNQWKSTS